MDFRQGSVIQIPDGPNPEIYRLVITHDCDLEQPVEDWVETLQITLGEKDTDTLKGKTSRKLSFALKNLNGNYYYLHTDHKNREKFSKEFLDSQNGKVNNDIFEQGQLNILKGWLGARYSRAAFPTNFNSRLKNAGRINKKLESKLKPYSSIIDLVLFDLGDGKETELNQEEPYFLTISVVINDSASPTVRAALVSTCDEIKALFDGSFDSNELDKVILEDCLPKDRFLLTLDQYLDQGEYKLDHLSIPD